MYYFLKDYSISLSFPIIYYPKVDGSNIQVCNVIPEEKLLQYIS